jgi:hypothetical protein
MRGSSLFLTPPLKVYKSPDLTQFLFFPYLPFFLPFSYHLSYCPLSILRSLFSFVKRKYGCFHYLCYCHWWHFWTVVHYQNTIVLRSVGECSRNFPFTTFDLSIPCQPTFSSWSLDSSKRHPPSFLHGYKYLSCFFLGYFSRKRWTSSRNIITI